MSVAMEAPWSVAGEFLDALARRDFTAMRACLDAHVRFRALVPPGLVDLAGPDATVARLQTWFGAHDVVDVIDASIGQIGTRVYLRWRIRRGHDDVIQVVEQHAFATVGQRIEAIDLLCSGFQDED